MLEALNKVYNLDCIEGMERLYQKYGPCIDLTITSPPYNIGKSYETKQPIDAYLEWSEQYLTKIYKLMKPNTSFMFQIGQYVDEHTNNIPLAYLLYPVLMKVGFKLRQEIVWHFRGGMQAKKKLTGQHEKILWLYKGDSLPYFDLDAIRLKEWQAIDKRNNPNGKNPTDVWEINRVTGNSKEKTGNHPCQFPVEMIERLCKGWSETNQIVLDPFSGSASTAIAALNTNRNFIGFELDRNYFEAANERIKKHGLRSSI